MDAKLISVFDWPRCHFVCFMKDLFICLVQLKQSSIACFVSDQQNVIIFYGYENKSTDKPARLLVAALKVFFRISFFFM